MKDIIELGVLFFICFVVAHVLEYQGVSRDMAIGLVSLFAILTIVISAFKIKKQ